MADKPLFDREALAAQLKTVQDLPRDQAAVGVVATADGDVGIKGSASKDIGAPGGWSFGAAGEWMRKAGGSVAGMFQWKGKGAK